jgi:tetratricopeptide (TPR) repeat protein
MLRYLALGVFAAFSLSFYSCHSNQENTSDVSSAGNPADNEFNLMEKKLDQDSTNIELRNLLASRYYSAGKLNNAAFHYLKIYEQDHKNFSALFNLGNIYYDSQQDDKAIEYYEKAMDVDSTNINIRCDLATCYSNINKMKKAIDMLRGNIKMDARHEKSHYNLSVILRKSGDIKGADKEMEIYKTLTSGKK